MSILKEVSQKCFVFGLQRFIFEGSLAEKLCFSASKRAFWRRSRTKASFFSFTVSFLKEVSQKSFVLQLYSFVFAGSVAVLYLRFGRNVAPPPCDIWIASLRCEWITANCRSFSLQPKKTHEHIYIYIRINIFIYIYMYMFVSIYCDTFGTETWNVVIKWQLWKLKWRRVRCEQQVSSVATWELLKLEWRRVPCEQQFWSVHSMNFESWSGEGFSISTSVYLLSKEV